MQRFYRLFAAALTAAVLFPGCSTPTTAEEFASGGSAAQPAIAAYESWMQFASPDTHTPAIDTDGCLNYALAKMSVRYHLPVSGVDLLSDSYTYYTAFTNQLLSGSGTKMDQVADAYSAYLTREETVWLSGSTEERMEQAYTVCAENSSNAGWCCILQMTTASGQRPLCTGRLCRHHAKTPVSAGLRLVVCGVSGRCKDIGKGLLRHSSSPVSDTENGGGSGRRFSADQC